MIISFPNERSPIQTLRDLVAGECAVAEDGRTYMRTDCGLVEFSCGYHFPNDGCISKLTIKRLLGKPFAK